MRMGTRVLVRCRSCIGIYVACRNTRRTPVVHWSNASLFSPGDNENAWNLYFEPIGPNIQLLPPEAEFFPSPWSNEALNSQAFCQVRLDRPGGSYGIGLLPRHEQMVVSDTYVGVPDLWPWLEPGDVDFGTSPVEAKRRLARKYLRFRPHLVAAVDSIWSQHMAGRRWLAVHIRGSDKGVELDNLEEVNNLYPKIMDDWISKNETGAIFLMTDSIQQYFKMKERYGSRILVLKNIRTQSKIGVHLGRNDPVKVAEQVIIDTLLASRCEEFLGNGASNVSLAVECLKEWPVGAYRLIGPDWRDVRFAL